MQRKYELTLTLLNRYEVDLGTPGLILNVESREEMLADKLVTLALRPNRIKYRDVWDIVWLSHNAVDLQPELVARTLDEQSKKLSLSATFPPPAP